MIPDRSLRNFSLNAVLSSKMMRRNRKIMKKPARLWRTFESIPGLTGTLADWNIHLGSDYEAAKHFLRPKSELATSVPCPAKRPCDCAHSVVVHAPDDIVAVC